LLGDNKPPFDFWNYVFIFTGIVSIGAVILIIVIILI